MTGTLGDKEMFNSWRKPVDIQNIDKPILFFLFFPLPLGFSPFLMFEPWFCSACFLILFPKTPAFPTLFLYKINDETDELEKYIEHVYLSLHRAETVITKYSNGFLTSLFFFHLDWGHKIRSIQWTLSWHELLRHLKAKAPPSSPPLLWWSQCPWVKEGTVLLNPYWILNGQKQKENFLY